MQKPPSLLHLRYATSPEAKEIFDEVKLVIRREITEVSYNTWIRGIVPIKIEENIFKLAVESEFQKGIIEGRYKELIKTVLLFVTDRRFELEFFVGSLF